jgi:hypothetical protein
MRRQALYMGCCTHAALKPDMAVLVGVGSIEQSTVLVHGTVTALCITIPSRCVFHGFAPRRKFPVI